MSLISEIPTGAFIVLSVLIAGFFAVSVPRYNRASEASNKFRPFIPWYKRSKFDHDWNNFRGFDKDDCFS